MDGLFAIAVLVVLAIPVSIVVLLVGHSGMRKRLGIAEQRITELQAHLDDLRNSAGATVADPVSPSRTPVQTTQSQAPPETVAEAARPIIPPLPSQTVRPAETRVMQPAETDRPKRPPSPVAKALSDFGPWLQENWFYAVSAASLALAGIFLVQYGMENGLLPPRARVAAAIGFGGALIGMGEFIRRRFGDGRQSATAYLPSVFSGAGVVTLFGAILSARMLYDLIAGGMAMTGMVVVALIAVVLGWMHGPLLVAVGVIGAYGAPLVLNSSNQDASPLFAYFAIVAVLGLGVDTIRRWGWISALTLVLAYFMGFVVLLDGGGATPWTGLLYFGALPLIGIMIPARSMMPDHGGPPALVGTLRHALPRSTADSVSWPEFPTLLAFGAVAASCLIVLTSWKPGAAEIWLSVGVLALLSMILIAWSHRAPALQDAAVLPALTLVLSVFAQSENRRVTYTGFAQTYSQNVEAAFPWIATLLVCIGVVLSAFALWRALCGGRFEVLWAAFAAVYAPAMAIVLELGWHPAIVIGSYPWALHAAVLAGLMVLFAERLARVDGPDRLRVSFAVMSALSCLAFAFVVVLSAVALTVALAVTVVAAAALDRRWNLPPLTYFVAAGVVTLGFRLVVDPGLAFAGDGPLPSVLIAYLGTLSAFCLALWLLRPLERPTAQVMLESAAWSTAGLTTSVLLLRWIEHEVGAGYLDAHWSFGLNAAIWLGLALAQVERTQGALHGLLNKFRWALAGLFALMGGGALLGAVTGASPLLTLVETGQVFGPVLLNTLAAAYVLPALVLLGGAFRLRALDRRLRIALAGGGAALLAYWLFTAIRHFWQGGEAMHLRFGISQPEQYTYTVVLLLVGGALFYQSLARRSSTVRKAGLVVIGLAVLKVFVVDVSDLDGLTRVFSLLVLGLALAGLAGLNRWAQARDSMAAASPPAVPPAPD